jgi:hypothetical protein
MRSFSVGSFFLPSAEAFQTFSARALAPRPNREPASPGTGPSENEPRLQISTGGYIFSSRVFRGVARMAQSLIFMQREKRILRYSTYRMWVNAPGEESHV